MLESSLLNIQTKHDMKKHIKSFNDRDNSFQDDLNNAIYNALADTVYKYSDMITDNKALLNAVNIAVDLWSIRYFDECEIFEEYQWQE